MKATTVVNICFTLTLLIALVIHPLIAHGVAKKGFDQLVNELSAFPEFSDEILNATPPSFDYRLPHGLALLLIATSLIVSTLLLRHQYWARWLTPLLPLFTWLWLLSPSPSFDTLYPSEAYVVEHYLAQPLASSVSVQREQLMEGWRNYLQAEWSQDGSYADGYNRFQLAQLHSQRPIPITLSAPILFVWFLWTVVFAILALVRMNGRAARASSC